MTQAVTVRQMTETLDITVEYGEEFIDNKIYTSEVSRPGLVLAGYDDYYPHERIQLFGRTEMSYLQTKTREQREEIFQMLCRIDTPAIVIARELKIPEELIAIAQEFRVPILASRSRTSRVLANITNYLENHLAERLSKHGVLLEVFGMGVLLVGASGVGKSETALELIQRGHRLVADDRVELYQLDELNLFGEAPEILQNLLEIRGLGIIDVMSLYGVSAIRKKIKLELIINLILDDGSFHYDRLGFDQEYEEIFEVMIPKIRIPVKTGRSLSVIIESAAMNHRATLMGYDAREMFNQKLNRLIEKNREEK